MMAVKQSWFKKKKIKYQEIFVIFNKIGVPTQEILIKNVKETQGNQIICEPERIRKAMASWPTWVDWVHFLAVFSTS